MKFNDMRVIKQYGKLSERDRIKLEECINHEFGHIPIVSETEWSKPNWSVIEYKEDEIISFYNIVLREIELDGQTCKVSGINNVITLKKYRGNGYASKLLRETEYLIFDEFKCQFGLLLCADKMIPYYENLNWYKVNCPVYFEQSNGINLWPSNAMLINKGEQVQPNEIKLNGLPW